MRAQFSGMLQAWLSGDVKLIGQSFNRDLSGYVAVGHSFRPGTYQVAVLNPIDPSLLQMGPEKSDSAEIGLKGYAEKWAGHLFPERELVLLENAIAGWEK